MRGLVSFADVDGTVYILARRRTNGELATGVVRC